MFVLLFSFEKSASATKCGQCTWTGSYACAVECILSFENEIALGACRHKTIKIGHTAFGHNLHSTIAIMFSQRRCDKSWNVSKRRCPTDDHYKSTKSGESYFSTFFFFFVNFVSFWVMCALIACVQFNLSSLFSWTTNFWWKEAKYIYFVSTRWMLPSILVPFSELRRRTAGTICFRHTTTARLKKKEEKNNLFILEQKKIRFVCFV